MHYKGNETDGTTFFLISQNNKRDSLDYYTSSLRLIQRQMMISIASHAKSVIVFKVQKLAERTSRGATNSINSTMHLWPCFSNGGVCLGAAR
jgi:hypothetical protein